MRNDHGTKSSRGPLTSSRPSTGVVETLTLCASGGRSVSEVSIKDRNVSVQVRRAEVPFNIPDRGNHALLLADRKETTGDFAIRAWWTYKVVLTYLDANGPV